MKKKIRNFIGAIVTVLLMAVIMPIQANATVTVVSGNGSEQNPYGIIVGGISIEEPFTYNLYPDSEEKYYYASSLTLKSTENVQVTFDDPVNGVSIKRTKDGPGKAAETFIVRGGETVYLKISARKGGSSTLKITVKGVNLEEYCPNNIAGTHGFNNGECRFCKYKCKHPRRGRKYTSNYEQITVNGVSKHVPLFRCNICENVQSYSRNVYYDETEAKACTPQKWSKENASQQKHHGICTVCEKEAYMPCEYEIVYKKYDYSKHYVDKKCKVCGGYDGSYNKEKHTFKKNVCTKCNFKRVIPGKPKIKSFSGKVKSNYVTIRGHWSGNYWIPARRAIRYTYEISCKMSSKNAKKYILADTKSGEHIQGIRTTSKKNRIKVKFNSYKRIKKYTVYAYSVSKTGTPSKVVKKVVRFS